MSIRLKTRKMLWGRSANRCAICRCELVIDSSEPDDESIIGDECHIVSRSPDGPRGNNHLPSDHREKFGNLILLCKIHHKQIDDQENTFSVEKLHSIKSAHEQLDDLRSWLFSRIWPRRYPELDAAFKNFSSVLEDFYVTFKKHSEELGDEGLITKKFYKIPEWNPELYSRLSNEYEFNVDLVEDLMLELTRAANYVCDKIRQHLFVSYRIKEGVLIVESGPNMSFEFVKYRVEYKEDERTLRPYPGLDEFLTIRAERDMYFGEGTLNENL